MRVKDSEILETSRRYNVEPGSLKCLAFALFDQGYKRREIRYLLRHEAKNPKALAGTIAKYHRLWMEHQ